MSKILILGSGISGCTAALELAQQGHTVDLIESENRVGGKVLSYCCKATDECMRCGVCIAHTTIAKALKEPRINIITGASILNVRHSEKKIFIEIARLYPCISYDKCIGCDACVAACPSKSITKYNKGGLIQYTIDYSKCLLNNGKKCSKCVTACPTSAISGKGKTTTFKTVVDAVMITTGHQAYDATQKPRLGYGRIDGVMTGEEAEDILSRQSFLKSPSDDIAFVQCVGSRDPEIGRNYCSSVCCSYASGMARILKYRNPDSSVTIYFIDLQNFDKTFSNLRRCMIAEGVQFKRSVPFSIEKRCNGRLKLKIEGADGNKIAAEHDIVILSVGMGPAPDAPRVANLFGLEQDEFGFLKSSISNVFVSGTCAEPQSINNCMSSAKSMAFEMMKSFHVFSTKASQSLRAESSGIEWPRRSHLQKSSTGVKTKSMQLCQQVMVIGGGVAGAQTSRELNDLGYKTIVIERSDKIGGQTALWNENPFDCVKLLKGIKVIKKAHVSRLTGHVGNFTARIETASGSKNIKCGAIVICSGINTSDIGKDLYEVNKVLSVADLNAAMPKFSNQDRPRIVGIVLDMNIEETKASTEMALKNALYLQETYQCEVYVFCREMRVAAKHLENLYDQARESGINIIKYEGDIHLDSSENEVLISTRDLDMAENIVVACHIAGISPYGLGSFADTQLIDILGIGKDSLGQMQDNNIHLFASLTNRPGIFVVGACRGQYYLAELINDAKAAALDVHSLLSQKHLNIELSNAIVDADKCALCLTCVRSCPYGAMVVDTEKGVAMSLPEVCQKCGICVGECPAGAIELPDTTGVNSNL